jgi:hypothetical protein
MTARDPVDRRAHWQIRDMLQEWACWQYDRHGLSYPRQAAFVQERVQTSSTGEGDHREMPQDLVKLNREIDKLAPGFKRIVALEYIDRRPQKAKAADLGISREAFSARLRFVHEHLGHIIFGV